MNKLEIRRRARRIRKQRQFIEKHGWQVFLARFVNQMFTKLDMKARKP